LIPPPDPQTELRLRESNPGVLSRKTAAPFLLLADREIR